MTEDIKLNEAKSLLRELYSIIKVETSPFAREKHKSILAEVESFLTVEEESN